MPLKKGKSQAVISANIKEMMDKYKATGKIGNIHPRSKTHALAIAQAAAMRSAKRPKKKK